ncbi:MAG TPA: FGGY family carbohydrate kinase [Acidimicrobiia bacterium]|nr:FGGY family carbohydrate kinase [Acidimicrobiia bacterium]
MLLGIDVGTTRIKAVVVDGAGQEQGSRFAPTPFRPVAGGVEMDAADLHRALVEVVAGVAPAREEIAGIGVAGLAESGAPLRAGRVVAPVIAWHDGRGEETVASLERRFGPALARWTGRRVRTVSSLAKLGWLLDHGLAPPDRWLGVPELALRFLTGAEATEYSLAARTGAYHVTEKRFLAEVVAQVVAGPPDGPADGLFPPVLPAGAVMGRVSEAAADDFQIPAGIPVSIAGHDHLAAALGLGARPGDLYNSVGTAETLVRRMDAVPDVDRALGLDLAVSLWPGGRAWAVLASAVRAGLVVGTLADHLGVEPATLDRLAGGEGDDGGARGAGDPAPVDLGQGIVVPAGPPAEMWTATLRALAGRTAAAADRVASLSGPHRRLVVYGGGSRSPVWLRAKAEVVGVPVVACPVAEAAARGAALVAGVAAGWWPDVGAGPVPALDADGRRAGTMGGP